MHDPQLSVGREGERHGPLVNRDLDDFGERARVDDADRVVVFVDRDDAVVRRVVDDVGARDCTGKWTVCTKATLVKLAWSLMVTMTG